MNEPSGTRNFTAAPILRSFPDLRSSADPFWDRLAVTATWCELRADPSNPRECLRRDKTRPRVLERDYFDAVSRIAADLDNELQVARLEALVPDAFRLLVYFPDDELADGAAEVESNGYFDLHNCPPWETWVAMVEEVGRRFYNPYLVAYVPTALVEQAERGFDGPAEDCIGWVEDFDLAIRGLVRARTG